MLTESRESNDLPIEILDTVSEVLCRLSKHLNGGDVHRTASWRTDAWTSYLCFCHTYDMYDIGVDMLASMAKRLASENVVTAFVWASRFNNPHLAAQILLLGEKAFRSGYPIDPSNPSFPRAPIADIQPIYLHALWRVCTEIKMEGGKVNWDHRAGAFLRYVSTSSLHSV